MPLSPQVLCVYLVSFRHSVRRYFPTSSQWQIDDRQKDDRIVSLHNMTVHCTQYQQMPVGKRIRLKSHRFCVDINAVTVVGWYRVGKRKMAVCVNSNNDCTVNTYHSWLLDYEIGRGMRRPFKQRQNLWVLEVGNLTLSFFTTNSTRPRGEVQRPRR